MTQIKYSLHQGHNYAKNIIGIISNHC